MTNYEYQYLKLGEGRYTTAGDKDMIRVTIPGWSTDVTSQLDGTSISSCPPQSLSSSSNCYPSSPGKIAGLNFNAAFAPPTPEYEAWKAAVDAEGTLFDCKNRSGLAAFQTATNERFFRLLDLPGAEWTSHHRINWAKLIFASQHGKQVADGVGTFLPDTAVDIDGRRIIDSDELVEEWIRTVCVVQSDALQSRGQLDIGIVREASADARTAIAVTVKFAQLKYADSGKAEEYIEEEVLDFMAW